MCSRSKLVDGLDKCDLNSICTAFNPVVSISDLTEPSGIYLGAKPLLPGTTKRFSDLIEQMTPGNAAIIFKGGMSEETHSLGHFVSLWRATLDENNDSERHFYFFDSIPKNSRAQLLGPWPSTRFNKCFHQTEAILSAFHRDIFVFNLPLDNKRRIEAIEEAMANMNRRFNYVLENYLRVQEFGVTLPINLFSLPVS